MDPITIGLEVGGLALSAFGSGSSMFGASKASALSQQEMQLQEQQNGVRQNQMQISNNRQQMEVLRNTQRQRSMALSTGVNQTGATTGSGTQGGMSEVSSEGNTGLSGLQSSLELGNQMFSLDNQINSVKSQMANNASNMATDQGIASLGGAMMKAGPSVGAMTKGFGSSAPGSGGGMFFNNSPWGIG